MGLLTVRDASRILDRSADAVRAYADNGKLPAFRTRSGQRLFKVGDVERLAKTLAATVRDRVVKRQSGDA